MADDFSALFAEHFTRWGKTQTEFADLVGTTQPTVALVLSGKRTPRPAALERWADVLGLQGDRRARFIEAGRSARAANHQAIAPYVRQLEDDLEEAHRLNGVHADELRTRSQALTDARRALAQFAALLEEHEAGLPDQFRRRALEILERVEPEAEPGESA